MNQKYPLGVIDSGIGGLSVVNALRRLLPSEDIVYLADPRHFPYGEKTNSELINIIQPFFSYLLKEVSAKLVLTACGSVSSTCLPMLNHWVPVPVMGIIEPGVAEAISVTQSKVVAVLATNATVKSGAFRHLIQSAGSDFQVVEHAWPELIEAVERGNHSTAQWFNAAKRVLESLRAREVDTVIMGCTHFSLVSAFFEEAAEGKVNIVDPATACARQVRSCLQSIDKLNDGSGGRTRLLVRGDHAAFKRVLGSITNLVYQSFERFPDEYENEHFEQAIVYPPTLEGAG